MTTTSFISTSSLDEGIGFRIEKKVTTSAPSERYTSEGVMTLMGKITFGSLHASAKTKGETGISR